MPLDDAPRCAGFCSFALMDLQILQKSSEHSRDSIESVQYLAPAALFPGVGETLLQQVSMMCAALAFPTSLCDLQGDRWKTSEMAERAERGGATL